MISLKPDVKNSSATSSEGGADHAIDDAESGPCCSKP